MTPAERQAARAAILAEHATDYRRWCAASLMWQAECELYEILDRATNDKLKELEEVKE